MRRAVLPWLLAAAAAAASACTVQGQVGTPIVYVEPPAPQTEIIPAGKPGNFWIAGHWGMQNGDWAWQPGLWEHMRAGYVWQPGQWLRRGNAWHWIDGYWTAAAALDQHPTIAQDGSGAAPTTASDSTTALYPTDAPPPPKTETPSAAPAGQIWIAGHWDWQRGDWVWLAGHLEPSRDRMVWTPGRWELQGAYYVWITGGWMLARR